MFKNYIDYQEIYHYFPRIANWTDASDVNTILNSAAMQVSNDLRRKNIDVSRIYIPLMFDDLAVGESTTKTDYVSNSLLIGNEARIVVKINSTTGCTISASGSRDDKYYTSIKALDNTDLSIVVADNETGIFSKSFADGYNYIKYSISGNANYSIYMVDTAFDMLIIYKAVTQITLPLLGGDTVADEIYRASLEMYHNLLVSQTYDYDINNDGVIDGNEANVSRRYRIMR